MGAYEEAPQRGADAGKGHALSFRASTSKQRLIKNKKSVRACLSVAPFYLWLHVPFRIEAVIKILKFRVFFPYVLILIESLDALPFSASSHLRVMREGYPSLFLRPPSHPFNTQVDIPGPSRSWRPKDAAHTMPLQLRWRAAPHTSGGTQCYRQDPAAAGPKRSQPRTVCRIAHQLDALIAFGSVCFTAHRPDACVARRSHQCLRLFHASQVTHLAPGRTRIVDHGGI